MGSTSAPSSPRSCAAISGRSELAQSASRPQASDGFASCSTSRRSTSATRLRPVPAKSAAERSACGRARRRRRRRARPFVGSPWGCTPVRCRFTASRSPTLRLRAAADRGRLLQLAVLRRVLATPTSAGAVAIGVLFVAPQIFWVGVRAGGITLTSRRCATRTSVFGWDIRAATSVPAAAVHHHLRAGVRVDLDPLGRASRRARRNSASASCSSRRLRAARGRLVAPAERREGGAVWLVFTYLLHTFGELSLSRSA